MSRRQLNSNNAAVNMNTSGTSSNQRLERLPSAVSIGSSFDRTAFTATREALPKPPQSIFSLPASNVFSRHRRVESVPILPCTLPSKDSRTPFKPVKSLAAISKRQLTFIPSNFHTTQASTVDETFPEDSISSRDCASTVSGESKSSDIWNKSDHGSKKDNFHWDQSDTTANPKGSRRRFWCTTILILALFATAAATSSIILSPPSSFKHLFFL